MGMESIRLSAVFPVPPSRIYGAWLDSTEHSRFTGGQALIDPQVGGKHSAWDGYIWGTTLELEPDRRIVQAWRTTDFAADHSDSRLEVLLKEVPEGTEVVLLHGNIPEGQGDQYAEGWRENYFEPMAKYFGVRVARARGAAKAKAKARVKARAKAKAPAQARAKARAKVKGKAKAHAKVKVKVKAAARARGGKKGVKRRGRRRGRS